MSLCFLMESKFEVIYGLTVTIFKTVKFYFLDSRYRYNYNNCDEYVLRF